MKCDTCGLTQFPLGTNLCRRCRVNLDVGPAPTPVAAMLTAPATPPTAEPTHISLAAAIRARRINIRLSQRQVAERMKTPRTYVSKLETSRASPTMSSLERLCRALEISTEELIADCEVGQQKEVHEMLRDPFLASLRPSLPALSLAQMGRVLAYASDLAAERARRNEAVAWLSS